MGCFSKPKQRDNFNAELLNGEPARVQYTEQNAVTLKGDEYEDVTQSEPPKDQKTGETHGVLQQQEQKDG